MACQLLVDQENEEFCFYNGNTGHAFGPVLSGGTDEAIEFRDYVMENHGDPRLIEPETKLMTIYSEWKGEE